VALYDVPVAVLRCALGWEKGIEVSLKVVFFGQETNAREYLDASRQKKEKGDSVACHKIANLQH